MKAGRVALVVLSSAALVLCTAAAGRPSSPPVPLRPLPALTRQALTARYAADRATIGAAASRTADPRKAERLRALAAPGRTFLDFDPRGRAVEVVGDLAS